MASTNSISLLIDKAFKKGRAYNASYKGRSELALVVENGLFRIVYKHEVQLYYHKRQGLQYWKNDANNLVEFNTVLEYFGDTNYRFKVVDKELRLYDKQGRRYTQQMQIWGNV
jgi:hypothetical protein